MNQRYTVRAEAPLLRPGLSIQCEVSRNYVTAAKDELMALVREINDRGEPGPRPVTIKDLEPADYART